MSVQTAAIEGQFNRNITDDSTIAALVRSQATGYGGSTTVRTQPGAASTPAESPQSVQAGPKNGTYTFYPRPMGKKGGADGNGWLAKIVVRNGNMDLYLVDRPIGGGTKGGLSFGPSASLILQDLDNPSKFFTAIGSPRFDEATGAHIVPFRNVTSTRFSYIETQPNPMWIIEGIILGEPDS